MIQYALRVVEGHEFTGDIIAFCGGEWSAADNLRRALTTPTEIVQLDDNGDVIEPACPHKCPCTSDMECPHDCPCEDR